MDMLVHLLDLPAEEPGLTALAQAGIRIRRAMAPDKLRVVDWVKEHGEGYIYFITCFSDKDKLLTRVQVEQEGRA